MIEKYILVSVPTRRFSIFSRQFAAKDGDRIVWIPSFKQATHFDYSEARRIRERFVGGNIRMVDA